MAESNVVLTPGKDLITSIHVLLFLASDADFRKEMSMTHPGNAVKEGFMPIRLAQVGALG